MSRACAGHHGPVTGASVQQPTDQEALGELERLLRHGEAVVLSGAGLSTESGIPDYRGPSGAFRRGHTPMTYQTFVTDPDARRRYWARSYLGWKQMRAAQPNDGHRAVATLQAAGALSGIITQNVDALHQKAGARDVIELHGGLDRTICLNCGDVASRVELDRRLTEANPGFTAHAARINPDGDAELADGDLVDFEMVSCLVCDVGPLKPDVVFFGETVPRERVERCFELVDGAASLLVLGSSLTVMSGYRFVVRAAQLGLPVAIVNQGPTRADAKADVRIDAPLGPTLTAVAAALR
jgi:NAD-dependent SIR2 family protein deacetylase